MIDVALAEPTTVTTVSAGPPQFDAHVRAYLVRKLRRVQHENRQRKAAERYTAAVAAEPLRVAAIAAGQAMPVEPVRHGRDVEKRPWVDPEQTNSFSKEPQRVHGFRRIDELVRLQRRGTLTLDHLAAGLKLREDFELSEGVRIGATPLVVRVSNPVGGATQVQLDALTRYRNAIRAVGQTQSGIVIAVVLENRTVTTWAEKRAMSITRATGYLEGAMDRLFDHYKHDITAADMDHARDA